MSAWKATLDTVLPPPGIDLRILKDPAALRVLATRAMTTTAARVAAPPADLHTALAVLFEETAS